MKQGTCGGPTLSQRGVDADSPPDEILFIARLFRRQFGDGVRLKFAAWPDPSTGAEKHAGNTTLDALYLR